MRPYTNPRHDDFRDRLRACADKVGGIRALSRLSGVSEAMLYRYLSGACDAPRRALIALAEAAGMKAGWLAAGDE